MSYIGLVDGSVRRAHQLTGQWERSPGGTRPTLSATESRYGIVGTDLGSSFFDGEKLWFLFGDTHPDPYLGDAFAWTTDSDPELGLTLNFLGGAGDWRRPKVSGRPRGFTTGVFEVPTGGFALGGRRYVIFTTDHYETIIDGVKADVMGAGVLCRQRGAADDLADLQYVFDLSDEKDGGRFVNASPVVVESPPPGLRFDGPALFVWGSGTYRHSQCYLAAVSAAVPPDPQLRPVEDPTQWWYLSAVHPDGSPEWSRDQHASMRLFDAPGDGGIGELSAAWIAPLRVWMLTYGLEFRTAPLPWGPWSDPLPLDNATNPAVSLGRLLHLSWEAGGIDGTDLLYDPGHGVTGGAPYGPYLIDRFTRPAGRGRAQVWFTLSTWNPYQAQLMTAVLERRPGSLRMRPIPPFLAVGAGRRRDRIDLDPPVLPVAGHRRIEPDPPLVVEVLGPGHDRIDAGPPGLIEVLGRGHDRIDLDPPPLRIPTGGLSMLRSRFGPAGNNFELIVPSLGGGLLFLAAQNDPWPPAWGPSVVVGPGRVDPVSYAAASMALAVDPAGKVQERDRLMVAAITGDRMVYLYRDPKPGWPWSGPYPVIAVDRDTDVRTPLRSVRGNPALVASTYGAKKGNLELIVPDAAAGIRHFWFDNDPDWPLAPEWRRAPTFGLALGRVDAVALTQSVFGDAERGNLEVVARRAGDLHVLWRDATMTWQGPYPLVAQGSPVTGATGTPALLQSRYGPGGNDFQLVTPWQGGGLAWFWRDNSAADPTQWQWHGPAVMDPHTDYLAASLVAGPFGPSPGNLELVATAADGTVRHFYRESTRPAWYGAGTIPV